MDVYIPIGDEADAMDQDQLFLLTEDDGGHFGGGQEHQSYELTFMFKALGLPFRWHRCCTSGDYM